MFRAKDSGFKTVQSRLQLEQPARDHILGGFPAFDRQRNSGTGNTTRPPKAFFFADTQERFRSHFGVSA